MSDAARAIQDRIAAEKAKPKKSFSLAGAFKSDRDKLMDWKKEGNPLYELTVKQNQVKNLLKWLRTGQQNLVKKSFGAALTSFKKAEEAANEMSSLKLAVEGGSKNATVQLWLARAQL